MLPDDPPPDDASEPAAPPPPPRPAGLKQLFIGACLLLINPFLLTYELLIIPFYLLAAIVSLLAFLFSVAGLWKARRLRFRIYGVLLTLKTALPVAVIVGHYWHNR